MDACILHRKYLVLLGDGNHRAHRRIGHGISDHIGEHFLHKPTIPLVVVSRLDVHAKLDLLVLHSATELLADLSQHLADVQVGALQVEIAAAHPSRRKDFFHQCLHVICGFQTPAQVSIAVFVFAHLIDHALQLPLDDGDGSFQLMGYSGEKFHALLFLFPFSLNIFLQLPVCRAQAGQRIVELLRHFIQAGSQHTDFVFSVDFALPGHVQGSHPFCYIADTDQRLRVVPGTNYRPNDGDQ